MTRAQRAQGYLEFLAEEGYRPRLDADGDVVFKVEGGVYYILLDEDEEFFRLIYPNFWPLETEEERTRAERAAFAVTTRMKVVKVLLDGRGVLATVEMFCSPPESVHPVIHRSIRAIQDAVREFRATMRAGD